MIKYFVWMPSTLGPIAQIWHDKQTDGTGKAKETIGKPHELHPYEHTIGIEELKKRYPCEK